MAIIKYTDKELDLLARLMRAEAVGEGNLGMLMVGNVVVNRAISKCLTFKNLNTIYSVIYQTPGGFAGIKSNLFYASATTNEKNLAKRVLNGEDYYPATHCLWFYSPINDTPCASSWYKQQLSGSYKKHCFYKPDEGVCPELY